MELAWLEDFAALADSGSFTRAAEARNITQPAFSRRVRALEEWAGVPLFHRSAQGASLTAAGEAFHRGVAIIIRSLAELRRDAMEAGGRASATLHFAATHALSYTFFPRWMRVVEERTAIGPVRLVSDSMAACETLMLDGQAQFLLCHHHAAAPTRFDPRQFRSVIVGEDALLPLVACDSDRRARWSLDADPDIPLLAYADESGLGRIVAAQDFAARAHLRPVFSAQLAATLLGMAREGKGVAWLPASLAEEDVARGTLVAAGDAAWAVPVEVRLFRPVARQSLPAERFWSALA